MGVEEVGEAVREDLPSHESDGIMILLVGDGLVELLEADDVARLIPPDVFHHPKTPKSKGLDREAKRGRGKLW